jgi:hypothetical protein
MIHGKRDFHQVRCFHFVKAIGDRTDIGGLDLGVFLMMV